MWRDLPPPDAALRCVVVLPARNEAAHIVAALTALADQHERHGRPLPFERFEILLLANNCDDASAALARQFGAARPSLRLRIVETRLAPADANIGYVRRRLMDEACRRLESLGRGDGFIASTDADSRVAPDWIAAIELELGAGADAVGGRIVTVDAERPSRQALRLRRLDAAHSLLRSRLASLVDPDPADPWPRHHQHFGASLAVTVRAYRRAGGIPRVPHLEDMAFFAALQRADLRVRHSPRVRVSTSGRLDGRAEVGLSWQLRQWAEAERERCEPRVESAASFASVCAARALLRRSWTAHGLSSVEAADGIETGLQLPAGSVRRAVANAASCGSAWEAIESLRAFVRGDDSDQVPMSVAVAALRERVRAELASVRPR